MAMTKDERIAEIEKRRAELVESYKKRLAAEKARLDKKLRDAKRETVGERKRRNHLLIVAGSLLIGKAQSNEKLWNQIMDALKEAEGAVNNARYLQDLADLKALLKSQKKA